MTKRTLWRISNFHDLSGTGGTKVPGRWHHKGRPVVYLADCPATALLEVLVHFELDMDELPEAFTLLCVGLPDEVGVRDAHSGLPTGWSDDLTITRRIGDAWLKEAETLLLQVPTVIVPHNCNYVFNPLHPDAARVELTCFEFPVDPRLFPFES